MFTAKEPANVREEEATSCIMWISISFTGRLEDFIVAG
jgi:hypothetical protein